MSLWWRSLAYYRGTSAAVVLGVVAATAALTGALIVGASMRGSLQGLLLGRLGQVQAVIESDHFVAPSLEEKAVGYIEISGTAVQTESRQRANRVQIFGIDERFAALREGAREPGSEGAGASTATSQERWHSAAAPTGRTVFLNRTLADRIGAGVDDDVILRFQPPSSVSRETLLGEKDVEPLALRLKVAAVVPSEGLGGFTVQARQYTPANAFVPLDLLQRSLQVDGCNRIATLPGSSLDGAQLIRLVEPAELGLRARPGAAADLVSIESDALLVPPPVVDAVSESQAIQPPPATPLEAVGYVQPASSAAATPGPARVLNYLANGISVPGGGEVPYSTVVALDSGGPDFAGLTLTTGRAPMPLGENEILVNAWTAERLQCAAGDTIRLTYYVADDFGELRTESADFTLAGVVAMEGTALDQTLTPEYKGVTDSERISDWDPPFPVDLTKVKDDDEAYWDKYRGTPKAFLRLEDGVRLWSEPDERLGRFTALRIATTESPDALARKIVAALSPVALGVRDIPVRDIAAQASTGSTDFGGLFIGFSFFLIISAAMLVALLFRLGIERRSQQIGLLLAVGYAPNRVRNGLLLEGLLLSGIGALIGTAAAIGYAFLMLSGLRTWWSAAANAPFLNLHLDAVSLVGGGVGSVLVSLLAIAWALRGLLRQSTRSLLAGFTESETARAATSGIATLVFWIAGIGGLLLLALAMGTRAIPVTGGFFGGGALLLTAALARVRARMAHPAPLVPAPPGSDAPRRIGLRNVPRQPGRSMLTIGLIASATFLVVSLAAFRIDADGQAGDRNSGTGGNTWYAEATTPLVYDLNSAGGRENLGLDPDTEARLEGVTVTPYRLRDGDASSCLNLYLPAEPRLLGATPAAIARGGFSFGATLADDEASRANPWLLLERTQPDDAIPVIGDEAAIMWQWHKALGDTIEIRDARGRAVQLRIVALLRNSVLQDELIISEPHFERLFPRIDGYGFFLLSSPADAELAADLEADLEPYGFDAAETRERLRNYLAVQNTYISTFQTLGGLGLLLGAVGLIAVLLRNVWERRRELALLQALGFSPRSVRRMVLSENAALVLAGLGCGVLPALLVIAPLLARQPDVIPWGSIAISLGGVLVIGLGVAALAVRAALRGRLVTNLREE